MRAHAREPAPRLERERGIAPQLRGSALAPRDTGRAAFVASTTRDATSARTWRVKRRVAWLIVGVVVVVLALLGGLAWRYRVDVLLWHGGARDLREAHPEVPVPEGAPTVLLLALDGVPRAVLYEALRGGRMPELAALLGGDGLSHAYLDETMLSTLPSSTLAAWATIFTGEPPAQHGVVGNEYFVRDTRTFAAPGPVSLTTIEPVLLTYADSYADDLLAVPRSTSDFAPSSHASPRG